MNQISLIPTLNSFPTPWPLLSKHTYSEYHKALCFSHLINRKVFGSQDLVSFGLMMRAQGSAQSQREQNVLSGMRQKRGAVYWLLMAQHQFPVVQLPVCDQSVSFLFSLPVDSFIFVCFYLSPDFKCL